jgi:hypothetical protein
MVILVMMMMMMSVTLTHTRDGFCCQVGLDFAQHSPEVEMLA